MYKSNIHHKKTRGHRNEKKRELIYPEEGQEYGFVQDMLGNGRVNVFCEDGKKRMGRIRGTMRKFKHKVIINMGDIILISRRDYEDDKVDVVHKYSFEEANYLSYHGELPEKINKVYQQKDSPSFQTHNDDTYIVFAEDAPPVNGTTETSTKQEQEESDSEDSLDIDEI